MRRVLRRDRGDPRSGAAVVELAVAFPMLMLVFLSIVDLGMVVWEHQVLENAAREAARYSALPANWVDPVNPNATVAEIQQRVIDYLQGEGITVNVTDISVDQSYPITVGGLTVLGSEISVSYTRQMLLPGGGLLPFGQVQLTARAVFRNLY